MHTRHNMCSLARALTPQECPKARTQRLCSLEMQKSIKSEEPGVVSIPWKIFLLIWVWFSLTMQVSVVIFGRRKEKRMSPSSFLVLQISSTLQVAVVLQLPASCLIIFKLEWLDCVFFCDSWGCLVMCRARLCNFPFLMMKCTYILHHLPLRVPPNSSSQHHGGLKGSLISLEMKCLAPRLF